MAHTTVQAPAAVLARRLVILTLIAAPAAVTVAVGAPAVIPCLLAACLAVVLAGTWETTRSTATAWAVLAAASCMLTSLLRRTADTTLYEDGVAFVLVPAVLVVLSQQANAMTQRFGSALTVSEIARAKLDRSNRELDASMRQSKAALGRLGTIVEALADGLVAVSMDGAVQTVNPAAQRLLGMADGELPADLVELVRRCLDSDDAVHGDLRVGQRLLFARAAPLHDDALWGVVVLIRDVTLEREIDRMKSDFAATVSHEMRTPMTSVLGFNKITRNELERRIFPSLPDDLPPRVKRAVSDIRDNLAIVDTEGQRLTALINDVLDISKMESGQMEWELRACSPSELVEQATNSTRSLFADGSVELRVDLDDALPDVQADADRIVQVLVNLIGNAVKFTDVGSVTVSGHVTDEGVELAVTDTGIGVAEADRDSIFEKFRQVGDVLTDRPGGTGLGLPISREIVQSHGGRIWVEDADPGSRFAFLLPTVLR